MTSVEQIAALKEGRIDVGFGRIPLDDPALDRQLLRNEKLIAAIPGGHTLSRPDRALSLADLAVLPLIVYPKAPRPSYADQVLSLFREAGLKPPFVHEVRELQTALGLVAADEGICLVPASIETLRRDNVVYRKLDAVHAVSPIIMSSRKGDRSPEIALVLRLIRQMYRREKIAFGA
jgi:LysR family transcriptional regulator, benzoate and cis,cis-muconate-responsive activator of ben and cat genes